MNSRIEAWLVRALRPLAWFVIGALGLLVPVSSGLLVAQTFGSNPTGLAVAMTLAALASLLWCRVTLTLAWWMKTGTWAWRSTGLRYSIRSGWGRR